MTKQQQTKQDMEEAKHSDEEVQPAQADEAAANEQPVTEETQSADEEETVESLKEALEEASAQAAENWDKYVRMKAEMDNIAKRSRRDVENAHKFAIEKLINELLPVWDSLELGLDHADGGNIDPDKLKEGHELTLRMLSQVMDKFNVQQIDPAGEAFDPERHEAMTMQPTDEVEPNCVLTVIQKGYLLNDRLIRPARVIVAKAVED